MLSLPLGSSSNLIFIVISLVLSWHQIFKSSIRLILGQSIRFHENFSSAVKINREIFVANSLTVQRSKIYYLILKKIFVNVSQLRIESEMSERDCIDPLLLYHCL